MRLLNLWGLNLSNPAKVQNIINFEANGLWGMSALVLLSASLVLMYIGNNGLGRYTLQLRFTMVYIVCYTIKAM